MFEALSDRFEAVFKDLRGKGKLKESDVDEALREIRLALLEADVNINVVKSFRDRVKTNRWWVISSASLLPREPFASTRAKSAGRVADDWTKD